MCNRRRDARSFQCVFRKWGTHYHPPLPCFWVVVLLSLSWQASQTTKQLLGMTAQFQTVFAQLILSVDPTRSFYTMSMEYFEIFIQSPSVSFTQQSFLITQLAVMGALKRSHLPPFIYTSCTHFTHSESCRVLMCHAILPPSCYVPNLQVSDTESTLFYRCTNLFPIHIPRRSAICFTVPKIGATRCIDLV